jgi:glycerol-3-phosphate dehydrogenase (NAD(P)+)
MSRSPPGLSITSDLRDAVRGANAILIAVPSTAFRRTLEALRDLDLPLQQLAWATKGFELDTGMLPHQVVSSVLGETPAVAVLSGPTFAREVGLGLPSAMTVAASDPSFAARFAAAISTDVFRAYTSEDMLGVEIGGATKNVYAIGAGISDGLGFGANSRIALVTRALSEMTRLGNALGARTETFMGLAGMGDLVLTCTDDQSRNRRFGLALGRGQAPEAALRDIGAGGGGLLRGARRAPGRRAPWRGDAHRRADSWRDLRWRRPAGRGERADATTTFRGTALILLEIAAKVSPMTVFLP